MEGTDAVLSGEIKTHMVPSAQDQSLPLEAHIIEEAPEDCEMIIGEPSRLESPKDVLNRLSGNLSSNSRYADLFSELDIEIAMESMRLRDLQDKVGEEQFISKSEFHDLHRRDGHKSTRMGICSAGPRGRSQSYSSQTPSVHHTHDRARSRNTWSPLFEIDIFPRARCVYPGSRTPSRLHWKSFELEYTERRHQLSKLTQTLPIHSPGIISTLERLTSIAYDTYSFFSIEVFELLLKARLNEKRPCTYKIVEASLRLIEYNVVRVQFQSVSEFHKMLHRRIQRNWPLDHPLNLMSSYLMAYILYRYNEFFKAEKIIRRVVRISLANLGLCNHFTVKTLLLLGRIIRDQDSGLLEEAGRLLRYNTEILEDRGLSMAWWESAIGLLNTLIRRRHYTESLSLCQHMMTWVEANLGRENGQFLRCQRLYVKVLRKQGKLAEAINASREALHHSSVPNRNGYFFNYDGVIFELARCLEEAGDTREAIFCYRKHLEQLRLYLKCSWADRDVLSTFHMIGICYESLAQYKDAALLYKRYLGVLQSCKKEDQRVERCIRRVQHWLARALKNIEQDECKNIMSLEFPKSSIEAYNCTNDRATEYIGPNEGVDKNTHENWGEIFGLKVQEREFSAESLGLAEEFLKLEISQS
ncbi:hypothetical protein ACMFMF_011375 [Clarireedia jacksonii]